MGVQCIDTQTQLPRPLLLSCRVCLPCVGKVYTRTQAEPGPTRLLPNHLGLPQTNGLGQCTPTGRYRSSSHKEDCYLPHGTHTTNDRLQINDKLHKLCEGLERRRRTSNKTNKTLTSHEIVSLYTFIHVGTIKTIGCNRAVTEHGSLNQTYNTVLTMLLTLQAENKY